MELEIYLGVNRIDRSMDWGFKSVNSKLLSGQVDIKGQFKVYLGVPI